MKRHHIYESVWPSASCQSSVHTFVDFEGPLYRSSVQLYVGHPSMSSIYKEMPFMFQVTYLQMNLLKYPFCNGNCPCFWCQMWLSVSDFFLLQYMLFTYLVAQEQQNTFNFLFSHLESLEIISTAASHSNSAIRKMVSDFQRRWESSSQIIVNNIA